MISVNLPSPLLRSKRFGAAGKIVGEHEHPIRVPCERFCQIDKPSDENIQVPIVVHIDKGRRQCQVWIRRYVGAGCPVRELSVAVVVIKRQPAVAKQHDIRTAVIVVITRHSRDRAGRRTR